MSTAVKVGIFLVGGAVLFCVGLFLIGSRAQLFTHHIVLYTEFTDISTMQTGAKVRVSGMDAGEITKIEVPKGPSSRFRLALKVDEKFHPVIRKDSVASIETEGMVGNKFINIKMGSAQAPECPAGCTLSSQEAVSTDQLMREGDVLAKTMKSTIDDLHQRADTAVQNISSVAGHADRLIVAVSPKANKVASNAVRITNNADAISTAMRQGHGAAGKLLMDQQVGSNVQATIASAKQTTSNLEKASGKVNTAAADAQDATHQLDEAVGTFLSTGDQNENTAAALRDAAHGAQQAATNLADDTDAVKHNFFLRGFFNRRGFYDLSTITPRKYAESPFVKKAQVRIWIAAADLFQIGSDGSQQLTESGRSVLEQQMSSLVPYLPNSPMVVEGYATAGTPAQEYLSSRQRAEAVRDYLMSRFKLKSEYLGMIPLGDHPPGQAGKETWDGICLALVPSKK